MGGGGGGTIGAILGAAAAAALLVVTGGAALALMPLGLYGTVAAGLMVGAIGGYAAGSVFDVLTMDFDIEYPSVGYDSSTYGKELPLLTSKEGIIISKCVGRCRTAGNIIRINDKDEADWIKMIVAHCEGTVDAFLIHYINDVEWSNLKNTDHAKWSHSGTTIQSGVTNLFTDNKTCPYRETAVTELKLRKGDEIRGTPNFNTVLRTKQLDIGQAVGGTESFTRSPGQVMWDWYVNVEGRPTSELNQNAFTALDTYCTTVPTTADSVPIRPPGPGDSTVKATSQYNNTGYKAQNALNKRLSLTGSHAKRQWLSANGTNTNQRVNIDMGVSYVVDKLVLENGHHNGGTLIQGIKNFTLQGSNSSSAFNDTSWTASGWTNIGVSQTAAKHTANDQSDPQTFTFTNSTAYRYYSLKVSDNYGGAYMGIRDVKLFGRSQRYTFDYNFDTKTTINDAKKLIWKSFNGMCIMDQGQIKPVWDAAEEHDGAGALQTKTSKHSFTQDNIVKDSITWGKVKRPNIVRVHYIDSSDEFKKSVVEIKDERDITNRGEVLYEENCWYITETDVAKRRARYKFDKAKYTDYVCRLTGFPDSSDLEVYDRVQITHTLPSWSQKNFLVRRKDEDEWGRPRFELEAYYSGIYHDDGFIEQENYSPKFSNPFEINSVENVRLSEGGFVAGDGTYVPYVLVYFDKPSDSTFWNRGQIWTSTSGTTYDHYGNAASGTTPGFRIESGGADFEEGDTLYVKVRSEYDQGVLQPIDDVSAVTATILGKTALPSDPENFNVVQSGDAVIFTIDRPSGLTDADFSHFEIREGSSWNSSTLVVQLTHTKYILMSYSEGAKLYFVKTVDTSGNKSDNYASKAITLQASTQRNVIETSNQHRRYAYADYFGPGINALTTEAGDYLTTEAGDYLVPERSDIFVDYDILKCHVATKRTGTDIFNTYTTGQAWYDTETKAWKPPTEITAGTFVTEVLDISSILSCSVHVSTEVTSEDGTSLTTEINISDDNITWNGWSAFQEGEYTFRYLKFRLTLGVTPSSFPYNGIELGDFIVTIDVPDRSESGQNVDIAIGGTTITFARAFNSASSLSIRLTLVEDAAKLPIVVRKITTGFFSKVYDTVPAGVTGIIDWMAVGY